MREEGALGRLTCERDLAAAQWATSRGVRSSSRRSMSRAMRLTTPGPSSISMRYDRQLPAGSQRTA